MSAAPGTFEITVPPGALGVNISCSNGNCVVSERVNTRTSLRPGDVIVAVNGVALPTASSLQDVVSIFQKTSDTTRKLTVRLGTVQPTHAGAKKQSLGVLNTVTNLPKKKAPSSKKATVAPEKKASKKATKSKKKSKHKKKDLPTVVLEEIPPPGFLCKNRAYYSTLNSETLQGVANKLGCAHWKDLAEISSNVERYGKLGASSCFKPGTLLRIPSKVSQWKIKKLVSYQADKELEPATCFVCDKKEQPNEVVLLCDGCDAACHLGCADLDTVPETDWFCPDCLDILRARRKKYGNNGTFQADPPPLPPLQLSEEVMDLQTESHMKLRSHLEQGRTEALRAFEENTTVLARHLKQREKELESKVTALNIQLREYKTDVNILMPRIGEAFGIRGFGGTGRDEWIDVYYWNNGHRDVHRLVYKYEVSYSWSSSTNIPSNRWKRAVANRKGALKDPLLKKAVSDRDRTSKELADSQIALGETRSEKKALKSVHEQDHRALLVEFASLSGEPQLPFETKNKFEKRETKPKLLGFVKLVDEVQVQAIQMLQEPDPLVILIPLDDISETNVAAVNQDYAIFARAALFDTKRDDDTPIDFNGIRGAQRLLMQLLLADERNADKSRTSPTIPSSVRLRGTTNDESTAANCFDLSELVRDCNCDLDMPMAATPPIMEAKGLKLRDYQRSSLQWMIDKEKEPVGLGLAGELWARIRFLDGDGCYYYCDLTGTLSRDIFDFRTDAKQKDAARNFGGLPSGGILGEEMGLGKSVISLALVVSNPPPPENLVLPREHKLLHVNHPEYVPPPSVVGAVSQATTNVFLSNATLIIVPMTLAPQWQREVERFAPWLSTLTLHAAEKTSIQQIASTDIVIVSTYVLQSQGSSQILRMIRRIHWHRIFVDESHYNQTGQKTKLSLSALSATYRYCVTGTPIGHSLDDLQGQLRFLRIPQFSRTDFWNNNIATPYHERNLDALQVLRSLLSRFVIRHAKEQTHANGEAMLSLPPRTVETVLLPFGSEAERNAYDAIEKRNRKHFEELRRESPATVLGKFIELTGMMYSARQACSHISMIDLEKVDRLNRVLDPERSSSEKKVARKGKKTRASILEEAVHKARPSAQSRMRRYVLQLQEGEIELLECPVCLEPVSESDVVMTPCGHPFCSECILNVLDGASSTREASGNCPQCRDVVKRTELTFLGDAEDAEQPVTHEEAKPKEDSMVCNEVNGFKITSKEVHVAAADSSTPRVTFTARTEKERLEQRNLDRAYLPTLSQDFLEACDTASSTIGTKVSRLIQEIQTMIRNDSKSKCVVFSQFLGVLDVAAEELAVRGIHFVRVDGRMKQHERADALLDFSSNPQIKVFLLSMRAGAVGLTLTAADHCFILDTPQNSAVEEQSIDRIHRIGATRPVFVKRFVMEGTVEERILNARRSLAADRPTVSTQIDGAGLMVEEQSLVDRPTKRARLEDEQDLSGSRFGRFKTLEALFGCSAEKSVTKA